MSESRVVYEVLQPTPISSMLEREQQRRTLARSLDELESEAMHLERALLHALNQVREMQGKRPVIVPRG